MRGSGRPGTHAEVIVEGTGFQHFLVQLGIKRLPKEDVVSDGGKLDPGFLGGQAKAFGQPPHCHPPTLPAESQASSLGGWLPAGPLPAQPLPLRSLSRLLSFTRGPVPCHMAL